MSSPVTPVLADSVRFDDDGVHILDRRVFPFERRWVHARTVEEVARAIEEMVTQSSGPYFAVLWGLALAARDARGCAPEVARERVSAAASRLIATRPTNDQPRKAAAFVLDAVAGREDVAAAAVEGARAGDADYRERCRRMGRAGAQLLGEGARVLTHCWGDLYLLGLVEALLERGGCPEFVCTETRPYLQGARLTAESLAEMGVPVTLVTDGMPASLMREGRVDALVTASDRVSMDGSVINKVGTLGLAVAARAFDVPFHALCHGPDPETATGAQVPIEFRDGDEVLHTLGRRSASDKVTGLYPAFDVTDPHLVSTVVTDKGAFTPERLHTYWH
ncbi:methylthioribose-1-phosphate isomerase [Saccharopolyspora sp. TS4A08]|uniref:Methylthioribose-1-phosphate isomerase n=1 Tax=Saccharopolyspora ipomoeae TaxID=3042027 RepID=A0ABT6PIU5_9PSEU|nr:methylthioribose-1-phosphate isomerase [Saccharopolyspora sp. TS4A08]MDI2027906.1 methylthioribose-1-phosphate isomerase [Saccharopolyspora sp. TS4A08]